jgi:hypothetical protein
MKTLTAIARFQMLLTPTRISGKTADLKTRLSCRQTQKADGVDYHRLV